MSIAPRAAIVVVTAAMALLVRAPLLDRQPLWADEVFSLAIATGHSFEHPAHEAQLELGDYVEPAGVVPAAHFQRYPTHTEPPASPSRAALACLPLLALVGFWTGRPDDGAHDPRPVGRLTRR